MNKYLDNINLADIYERYKTTDPDEDITVWVTGQVDETGKDQEINCIEIPAVLNDHPGNERSELYVTHYEIYNNPDCDKADDKNCGKDQNRGNITLEPSVEQISSEIA